jgi:hypothetical protein
MRILKITLLALSFGLASVCLAKTISKVEGEEMGRRGSLCGLVRAVYYEQGQEQVQTAEVTLESYDDSVRVVDAKLSRAVLVELGEDEQELRMPGFIRRITSLSRQLFERYIQVCLEDVLIFDEYRDGVILRSGYLDSAREDSVQIIEL